MCFDGSDVLAWGIWAVNLLWASIQNCKLSWVALSGLCQLGLGFHEEIPAISADGCLNLRKVSVVQVIKLLVTVLRCAKWNKALQSLLNLLKPIQAFHLCLCLWSFVPVKVICAGAIGRVHSWRAICLSLTEGKMVLWRYLVMGFSAAFHGVSVWTDLHSTVNISSIFPKVVLECRIKSNCWESIFCWVMLILKMHNTP